MADVLNQNEIDSLLSAISSGSIDVEEAKEQSDEKKIKEYDFKRPDKLSKEQMRTLEMIHDNLSRIFTTTLSTKLRSMVNFEVVSIEQLAYSEFINSLPEPTIISINKLEPLSGQFIFEINPEIGFGIIDRLFGGFGKPISDIRSFTDIERVVLRRVMNWLLVDFKEAWSNIEELEPELLELESNPNFIQVVPDSDMTIIITLAAKIGNTEGLINICLPYIVLEPIVKNLNAQYWFSSTREKQTAEHIAQLKERLNDALVEVEAELGSTQLTVEDFLYLRPGDVIRLDKKVEENAELKIGNNHKYQAVVGSKNRHKAIQIVGVAENLFEESGVNDE
ncbi:flagellar motor switch protein FliM [Halanaerobium congolense]|jgi:flagellar motor switch protein FliM|uniref:Flagellar motor switch protein FliM n=1 Tax=Halanaerobium congolense TaxID=54121 RepID=A0A1G6S6N4_9FIRM|nr:flagellar motor switch protein FliM [Halanaerobium congolense]KXS49955.1 MAG: flagellar motor switch protein FliM [Halanaerobium sp. T82-1]PUU92310.1 MAG: flagellar motor switch protein FliM [Halanaerobium sp.]TDP26340.1 flagellar motor switch protein FliM [Halanaerobium congolense]TDS34722.1 flagellar motor switch protein FliM [Halanaerobium congolense]SDD11787.1 flagellar motor switch protein FliM [Halanaerobium congolense]